MLTDNATEANWVPWIMCKEAELTLILSFAFLHLSSLLLLSWLPPFSTGKVDRIAACVDVSADLLIVDVEFHVRFSTSAFCPIFSFLSRFSPSLQREIFLITSSMSHQALRYRCVTSLLCGCLKEENYVKWMVCITSFGFLLFYRMCPQKGPNALPKCHCRLVR